MNRVIPFVGFVCLTCLMFRLPETSRSDLRLAFSLGIPLMLYELVRPNAARGRGPL